jgi:GDP-4-dehydro-6-deoxy-D-mannose reductase
VLPSRVLVTGAAGFVGGHLARALAARGACVIGLGPESGAPDLPLERWITADVCDAAALEAAIAGAKPDAIVNLAGQSSAARSFEDPSGTFRVNVIGAWSVLEAARRAAPNARVLLIGSGECYGPQPEGTRVAEDAPFRPVSPYALSKATADAMAQVFFETHGLDVVRTRSFGHTGPGQAPRFVLPSFAQQVVAIEKGGAPPVLHTGNLDVTRDLSDVRDIVEAYLALLERGRPGAVYNVGRGEGVKLADLVSRLAALAHVEVSIEVDPARVRPADVPYLVADAGLIERETGWRCRIPLDQTLADVLDEWRAREAGVRS